MDSLAGRHAGSKDTATDLDSTPVVHTFNSNEWNSPDDPDNGQNWSLPIRIYHTVVPAAFGFLTTFSSTVYVPGIRGVAHEFQVSTAAAIVPFSLFIMGYALGIVIAASCSETFGRRVVYWISIPAFALFVLGTGLSQTFPALVVCRFLAGLFGSPGLTVGSAILADVWKPEERSVPMTVFVAAPFVGPSMGALIGSFVVEAKGWRWTQWTTLFFVVAIYIPSLFIRETYKKTILERRARRSGILPPSHRDVSSRTSVQTARFFLTITLARPMRMIFTEPIVGFLSLYVAFAFAIVYAFYAAIPVVFEQVYGFSITSQGLVFLSLTTGYGGAVGTSIATARLRKMRHMRKTASNDGGMATPTPEESLYLAMLGGPALPIGLFWFGWTAKESVAWIVPMIAVTIYAWGLFLVFLAASTYIITTYGALYGASAVAATRLLSFFFAAVFPLFAIQMFSKLGVAWASSLLGFIAAVLTPVPWIFFRYGPKLREMSKY